MQTTILFAIFFVYSELRANIMKYRHSRLLFVPYFSPAKKIASKKKIGRKLNEYPS